ncbi:MAG: hypothetical protein V2I66_14250 [Halieaceae bacterium]|jgi:hypothetical protein|nr:hypothetical protein [Halieaceae bacterium]
MKKRIAFSLITALATLPVVANALELGAEDFVAAREMTCVLAQDSLGYLSADEYAEMAEAILADYDQTQTDVIYAQALGYFDGLMFGLPESDEREISARLQSFVASGACTRFTGLEGVSLTL